MKKIAIIGAGVSGLTAAHLLKNEAEVTVFEKSRGVGGRMSTRHAPPYDFDHGAQYFTARTQAFQQVIQPLIGAGVVKRWHPRHVNVEGKQLKVHAATEDDQARYVAVPGMNSLAKALAHDVTLHLNTHIVSLQRQGGHWQLYDEQGHCYADFDWVITAIPAPQALLLLPQAFNYQQLIAATKMQACFAVMLGFDEPLALPFDTATVSDSDLQWVAVNSHKPGRADQFTLVLHSSAAYAAAHLDDDREQVMQHLCAEAGRIIGCDLSAASYKTIHRWLYAANCFESEKLPVLIDHDLNLAACGDWCFGGRVEGAFLSAYHLVDAILKG